MAEALHVKLAKQQAEVTQLQRVVEKEARREVKEQWRREEAVRKEVEEAKKVEEEKQKKLKKLKGKGKAKLMREWSVGTPCGRCQLNGTTACPKQGE